MSNIFTVMSGFTKIHKYINKIKNFEKKRYARAYFKARQSLEVGLLSHESFDLSYMAKQAVRMEIDNLLG
jgi:hypothetical protein